MEPITPIYTRTAAAPDLLCDDPVYYVLAGNGLFIGRNTTVGPARFRSIVPAAAPPRELAEQEARLVLDYPRLPAPLLARVVGYFWRVARRSGAEAIVLLALNEAGDGIDVIVPKQTATVTRTSRGEVVPVDVRYELSPAPGTLPPRIIGDIHSHGFEAAYASSIDRLDEEHAPGLHVVMGRLHRDPPEIHAEFVVDGTRFDVRPERVLDLEGYGGRDPAPPPEWFDRVLVRPLSTWGFGAEGASRGWSARSWGTSWSGLPERRDDDGHGSDGEE
jgi:hypothetical protein